MSKCTCGGSHEEAPATEEVVEAEKSEALDEPIAELDKHEELYKDMEQTLGKLKEVMAYLEEMAAGDEKMMDEEEKAEDEEEEEEEEAPEEEEKAEDEEEEEEEEEAEEEEKSVAEKADDLHKSLTTLKKYGINVYTGKKATPAPAKNDSPKAQSIDWNNISKSWDELEDIIGEN
jgi:DNA repair exonuclease SbcCD ATPase subunit